MFGSWGCGGVDVTHTHWRRVRFLIVSAVTVGLLNPVSSVPGLLAATPESFAEESLPAPPGGGLVDPDLSAPVDVPYQLKEVRTPEPVSTSVTADSPSRAAMVEGLPVSAVVQAKRSGVRTWMRSTSE